MYGKPRVIIQKNGQIVLAGNFGRGGNWGPVGFITHNPWPVTAEIFKDRHDRSKGTEKIEAKTKKALKEIVDNKYKWTTDEWK